MSRRPCYSLCIVNPRYPSSSHTLVVPPTLGPDYSRRLPSSSSPLSLLPSSFLYWDFTFFFFHYTRFEFFTGRHIIRSLVTLTQFFKTVERIKQTKTSIVLSFTPRPQVSWHVWTSVTLHRKPPVSSRDHEDSVLITSPGICSYTVTPYDGEKVDDLTPVSLRSRHNTTEPKDRWKNDPIFLLKEFFRTFTVYYFIFSSPQTDTRSKVSTDTVALRVKTSRSPLTKQPPNFGSEGWSLRHGLKPPKGSNCSDYHSSGGLPKVRLLKIPILTKFNKPNEPVSRLNH